MKYLTNPFYSNYFRWKYLGAVAWRLPLRATLLLWPKTITTFWFSILSMCLNAQLQLSRPKYLRDRLLKGDEIFVFPKNPHFLIPVLSKNIVKLYREGSNAPTPIYCWKKNVKTLQKESRKKWYHIYTKKSIFLTRKITVRCSIKKMKEKENHLWCFTKLKFKKKNTKKTKQD